MKESELPILGCTLNEDHNYILIDEKGKVSISDSDMEKIRGWIYDAIKDAQRYKIIRETGRNLDGGIHPGPKLVDSWCDARIAENQSN